MMGMNEALRFIRFLHFLINLDVMENCYRKLERVESTTPQLNEGYLYRLICFILCVCIGLCVQVRL